MIARSLCKTLSSAKTVSLCSRSFASVTGTAYAASESDAPVVTLYTKEDCSLCDMVKEILYQVREEYPHTLQQVDIMDEEHADWYAKYKYDIPVLHLNDKYWIKHRMTEVLARRGLEQAYNNSFVAQPGQPDASNK